MNLVYKRKLTRSRDNKASVITIPRPIAQSWEQYDSLELTFNGTSLVVVPKRAEV